MNQKITQSLIWLYRILALVGVYGGMSISYPHFLSWDACPVLFSFLPACYLITWVFVVLLVLSFMKYNKTLLSLLLFGCGFALFATISNIIELQSCPISGWWIPACYIAATLFVSMTLCYVLDKKYNHS